MWNNIPEPVASAISLQCDGSFATLNLQDDGKGSRPKKVSGQTRTVGALGLIHMRERAHATGGIFVLNPSREWR